MANLTRQQTRYMSRDEFNALDKSTVTAGTEINIVDQIQKEDLSTDVLNTFTNPTWHTTAPSDTSSIIRTEISWNKDITYQTGSTDTITCSFISAGDGYARFNTNSAGEKLLIGCTNWSITGSSNSADDSGTTCVVSGGMYFDIDHNIAKCIVYKFPDGSTTPAMFLIPTDAKFRYLY